MGRDKTYYKIAENYHWKMLWKDVETYVRTCSVCQTTNDAKFMKEAAPLHPIPVKAEVWRQVCLCLQHVMVYFFEAYMPNSHKKYETDNQV